MIKVTIVQYRLLHYRTKLFELLRDYLRGGGVELVLVCGQPSRLELTRKDEGSLPWAVKVRNRFGRLGGKDIVWQPMPPAAAGSALCIVMQENRLLSNYLLQLRRLFRGPLVAFWGHGKNYQSTRPDGPREQLKKWLLTRVDWWFAYTISSRQYVLQNGFPADRVTTLNNAIDDSGFRQDLQGVTAAQQVAAKASLGIADNAQVAIYCGSIYTEKRIAVLLASADLLRQQLQDFHLLVVGEGPQLDIVQAAASTRPWLHVLGLRKGAEKALYYKLASVMLNPGLVGLHVVDAFVAQTPLVTQASAAHSPEYDYLVDGSNGRIVTTDDASSYAAAVAEIFNRPGVLQAMRQQCEADAQRYTLEQMARNFADGIFACLDFHGFRQARTTAGQAKC